MNTQTQTKRERSIEFIMNNPGAKMELFNKLTIVTYENASNYFCAVFSNRGNRPLNYYRYRSIDDMNVFISKTKQAHEKEIQETKGRLAAYDLKRAEFKAGTLLYCSWGYEQTNIDFYIILERKGDFVTVQEIGQKRSYDTIFGVDYNDRGNCEPDVSVLIGEPFKKKVSKYASINLASYKFCSLYDGKPKSWSSYA